MTQTSPRSSKYKKSKYKKNKPYPHRSSDNHEQAYITKHSEGLAIEDIDTAKLSSLVETSIEHIDTLKTARTIKRDSILSVAPPEEHAPELPADPDDTLPALRVVITPKNVKKLHADAAPLAENSIINRQDTQQLPSKHVPHESTTASRHDSTGTMTSGAERDSLDTEKLQNALSQTAQPAPLVPFQLEQQPLQVELPSLSKPEHPTPPTPLVQPAPLVPATQPQHKTAQPLVKRGGALLLILLLCVMVLQTLNIGQNSFIGAHGWAYVLAGPGTSNGPNLLKNINGHLHPTPGTVAKAQLTPAQYINLIIQGMNLDQKLGQMMIVQFVGPSYSLELSTMISQYDIGAVLIFSANQNIHDKAQLKDLIQQMQSNSNIPMAVAIDQEGGYVDRLATLDGPRPSEALIGASGDPSVAVAAGMQDAKDLTSYGINLNLAPVVDVTNVYNPQLYTRTYGNNPALVTKMASAYLQGLQKSGKVLGTLKHFPGLGDVAVDPHIGVPRLTRSLDNLNSIDWAPYRTLIQQGNIHAIMVTHELVTSVDATMPSSLSRKLVTGVLRQQLGFQGVIMTDSLTMEGILAYASESQAAAMAVEAGADLLMGASTASDVASMIDGIKHAITNGDISQPQIDASVRRILTMKYDMGLLPLPK